MFKTVPARLNKRVNDKPACLNVAQCIPHHKEEYTLTDCQVQFIYLTLLVSKTWRSKNKVSQKVENNNHNIIWLNDLPHIHPLFVDSESPFAESFAPRRRNARWPPSWTCPELGSKQTWPLRRTARDKRFRLSNKIFIQQIVNRSNS